uniref:Uncharacterized protein MANES_07G138900 n=1 Tax=Rhizophora mucronata TaxID=61149 RepID=A0A2P2NJ06_RHIMU
MVRNKEDRTRRGQRKPLSDCTNSSVKPSHSSSSSLSSAIVKSKIPSLSSLIPKSPNPEANSSSNTKTKVDVHGSIPNNNTTSNPSSVSVAPCASTPSRPSNNSSSLADAASCEVFEPCSVYNRRQSADKRKTRGKAIAAPSTCIPAVKAQSTWNKLSGVSSLSKSSTVPPKKKQRRTQPADNGTKHDVPQDFIEQQRAYFAEVDAFELPEEEVASIDDLD